MSLTSQRLCPKLSSKGCWTCKARKIGCDKTLPSCNNCARTKRCCKGYGVKLHWPESADGRRPVHAWDSLPHQQRVELRLRQNCSNLYFLNTTNDDLNYGKINAWSYNTRRDETPSIRRSLEYGYEVSSSTDDKHLLSYYHEVLAGMVTTIDDGQNGFRSILLPSALSHQSFASKSLHEAILALSALHLWGRRSSIQHKINSIRLLSQSIQANEKHYISQFGTCMMLCVCDVFDAVDGSWYSHMCAADTISRLITAECAPDDYTALFLTSWLAYHRILSEFSCASDRSSTQHKVPKIPGSGPQNQIIIGSLGCSMQVLECISCINYLANAIEQDPPKRLCPEISSLADHLESQLDVLQQVPRFVHKGISRDLDKTRITNTAELYRISTVIYLRRTMTCNTREDPRLRLLVGDALQILRKLGLCTSPWPLFIIACEITIDEERIIILDTLEKMQKIRRIGNVEIMRNIIEAVWKRSDLNAISQVGVRVNWKDLIDTQRQRPSFI